MKSYSIFFSLIAALTHYPLFSLASIKNIWAKTQTEVINKEIVFDSTGTIEIDNLHGSIKIDGWNRDTIALQITKTGSAEQLKNTKVTINATGKSFNLTTNIPVDNEPAQIDYVLSVPEKAVLNKICTNRGDITIKDVFGKISTWTLIGNLSFYNVRDSIEARTSRGSIEVKQKTLTSNNCMLLETMQGDIKLYLPQAVNAILTAKTSEGLVTSEHFVTLEQRTVQLNKETWNQFKKEAIGYIGNLPIRRDIGAQITIDIQKGNISLYIANNN